MSLILKASPMVLSAFLLAACEPQPAGAPVKPSDSQIEDAAKNKVAEERIAQNIANYCPSYGISANAASILQTEIARLSPNLAQPSLSDDEYAQYLSDYTTRIDYDLQASQASYCGLGARSIDLTEQGQSSVGKYLVEM